jgi:hypothetical protein
VDHGKREGEAMMVEDVKKKKAALKKDVERIAKLFTDQTGLTVTIAAHPRVVDVTQMGDSERREVFAGYEVDVTVEV